MTKTKRAPNSKKCAQMDRLELLPRSARSEARSIALTARPAASGSFSRWPPPLLYIFSRNRSTHTRKVCSRDQCGGAQHKHRLNACICCGLRAQCNMVRRAARVLFVCHHSTHIPIKKPLLTTTTNILASSRKS